MIPSSRAVPAEQFAEAWNGTGSLDEAGRAIRGVAGGPAPRWALMARAAEMSKRGIAMRLHEVGTGAETDGGGDLLPHWLRARYTPSHGMGGRAMADVKPDDETRDTARLRDRTSGRQKIPGPEPLPITGETEALARDSEPLAFPILEARVSRWRSVGFLLPTAILLMLAIAIVIVALA